MSNWLAEFFRAITNPEAAGVFGSLISLRWAPGDSWLAKVTSFLGGVGFALFISPLLVDYLEVKSTRGPLAFAFIGGLVGMNLLAKGWDLARTIDLREVLLRVLPNKEGDK